MNKKKILKVVAGSVLVVGVFGIALHTNIIKLPIQSNIAPQWVADFDNDPILVGFSHNVFAGRVMEKIGTLKTDDIPVTQFSVQVLYNIKGNLSGKVFVNQEGGYKNGILYVIQGGDVAVASKVDQASADKALNNDSFLQPGVTYLFFTRYDERGNAHVAIMHPHATTVLSRDSELNTAQLLTLIQGDEKVKKMQEAYPHEILLDVDVQSNNTRNSYESTHGVR